MWTAETRRTYDRTGLRYPTDVTDAEWDLARPFIDVAHCGSGWQGRVDLRQVLCSTSWAQAAKGALCPGTCPRAAPCTTTSCVGSVTARWGVCTMLFLNKPVGWSARRRAPRPRSWTARASKGPKDPMGRRTAEHW